MKKLKDLLYEILECTSTQLEENTMFVNMENWDSMRYMMLVMRLESEFGITLTPEEIQKLTSENEVLTILKEKGIHG